MVPLLALCVCVCVCVCVRYISVGLNVMSFQFQIYIIKFSLSRHKPGILRGFGVIVERHHVSIIILYFACIFTFVVIKFCCLSFLQSV